VLGTAGNLSKCKTLKPQQPVLLTAKLAEPLRPKTWPTLKPQLSVLTQISRGVLRSKLCHLPSVNKKVLDLHHTFPSWSNLFSWKSPWKIVPLFTLPVSSVSAEWVHSSRVLPSCQECCWDYDMQFHRKWWLNLLANVMPKACYNQYCSMQGSKCFSSNSTYLTLSMQFSSQFE
jgi:hypothetical protein